MPEKTLETIAAEPKIALSARAEEVYRRLREVIASAGPMVVGFSGGADSALLLKVASDVLPGRVIALTAVSPSLAESELADARAIAMELGVRHLLVESREMEEEAYLENSPRRCYFCKAELFRLLRAEADREGLVSCAYGAITDDVGDFRPGMEAASEARAIAPLLEAGISKQDVRDISRHLGLRTWNKPQSACLSSRVPFGTRIDVATLSRIERSEMILKAEGLRQVRVRDHGDIARVECAPEEFDRLMEADRRRRVIEGLKAAGFRFVCLDLAGYRSGSLNPINS